MAEVLEHEVRFVKVERGYDVIVPEPFEALGMVERITVSTDSPIAGTRLRRQGKGRAAWRARVPPDEARAVGGGGGREIIIRGWGKTRTLDVEWMGQTFDTRAEAAAVLVEWHEHPELRRGPAARR